MGTNEIDDDGDDFTECAGDCDETDPPRYPGASEVNDGQDDDCDELVDEVPDDGGFRNAGDRDEYCWTGQAGASDYEVARSLSGESRADCTRFPVVGTCLTDLEAPPEGEVFHYLVHAAAPHVGGWGADFEGSERTGIRVSPTPLDEDFESGGPGWGPRESGRRPAGW